MHQMLTEATEEEPSKAIIADVANVEEVLPHATGKLQAVRSDGKPYFAGYRVPQYTVLYFFSKLIFSETAMPCIDSPDTDGCAVAKI